MNPIKSMRRRTGRANRPTKWQVATYIFVILLSISASVLINRALQPEPWTPLGPYPEQIVTSQGPKVSSPSEPNAVVAQIKLGSKVNIKGVKTVSENVDIIGAGPDWVSNYPPGFILEGPRDRQAQRFKGTTVFDFQNDIPPEVDKWAREMIAAGRVPEVHLSGCETPIDGKRHGEPLCWRSQKFVLVLP